MTPSAELDNPFLLARELEGTCRSYLEKVQALPGRNLGFHFSGKKAELEWSSKSRYDAVRGLRDDEPLKGALLRWVHRLTEMRVNQPWLVEDERLYRTVPHLVRAPSEQRVTLHAMKVQVLASSPRESKIWWNNVAASGAALAAHRAEYLQRCAEVHARLGETDTLGYFSPDVSRLPVTELVQSQRGRLWELVQASGARCFFDLMTLGLGSEQTDGWPARLAPDSMLRMFSAPELFRGIDLKPGPLPERLVPASFARAAYQVGRALSLAWTPKDRPFVLLRDVDDLAGHRLGYLFVLWWGSSVFDEKVLGLGRSAARERRRSASKMILSLLAQQCLRVLFYERALSHRVQDEELGDVARELLPFSEALLPSAALSWWTMRRDEVVRFYALLDAAAFYRDWVEEYDEDWLRSPRALQRLRAEGSLPAPIHVERERIERGYRALLDSVSEDLS